ncbi:MAG: hypothetical protein CSA22_04460 [Deltaproteobacteria bacterium]|nr:MAG: hypothetical protein CSA22_04460 [Deltaproteobacteria bacterium]
MIRGLFTIDPIFLKGFQVTPMVSGPTCRTWMTRMRAVLVSPPVACWLGLGVLQTLSTIHLHRFNAQRVRLCEWLSASGFLTLPLGEARNQMATWQTAYDGALFFTATLGFGLAALAWLILQLSAFIPQPRQTRVRIACFAAAGLAMAGYLNSGGIQVTATLYTLMPFLSMLLFGLLAGKQTPSALPHTRTWRVCAGGVVLCLLFLLPVFVQASFLDIRDYLLLRSDAGRAMNRFYYHHTLYPAEVLKPHVHRQLKPLVVKGDVPELARIKQLLVRLDALPLDPDHPPDRTAQAVKERPVLSGLLRLHVTPDTWTFSTERQTLFNAPAPDLSVGPVRALLRRASEASDRMGPFRRLILISLVAGVPLFLGITLIWIPFLCYRRVMPHRYALPAAVFTLSLITGGVTLPFIATPGRQLDTAHLADALGSTDWRIRRNALIHLHDAGIDPFSLPGWQPALNRLPDLTDRYYFARCLAHHSGHQADGLIETLLDSPEINVVCKTAEALGIRGRHADRNRLFTLIHTSDEAYVQWYVYRALRKLGWRQRLP